MYTRLSPEILNLGVKPWGNYVYHHWDSFDLLHSEHNCPSLDKNKDDNIHKERSTKIWSGQTEL